MADRLHLLATAEVDIEGRMPWSSNATFLVNLSVDGEPVGQAIYKPLRGERPLWDFEAGLYRREIAAYELSEMMGFHVVPPTIVRDGPLGEGSLQWFVEADHQEHYFTIFEKRPDLHDAMRLMAVLDIVANNTDRKSGHVLLGHDGLAREPGYGCQAPGAIQQIVLSLFGRLQAAKPLTNNNMTGCASTR